MGRWLTVGLLQAILTVTSIAVAHSSQAQELKFGVTRGSDEAATRAEFDPLVAYLSNAIGRMVRLYVATDDADLRIQMEAGAVDVGCFSPLAYVVAARGGKIRVMAQSILDGSPTYRGLIIKRFDSGINNLTDLEDKRFAFVDPLSTAGYLYPRAMLIEKGINPERFFKETLFMGSDEKVIAAVLFGSAHAGAVYGEAVAAAKLKGLPTFDLEVLATTEPIPYDALAIRVDLEAAVAIQIQSALVNLNKSPSVRVLIVRNGKTLTGHVPADDRSFAVVRRAAKIDGI